MMRCIRREIMWPSRSPAAMPDPAIVDVSVGYASRAVQFRFGAGDAALDRSEALGQLEALLEEVRRRLMKEKRAQRWWT